MDLGLRRERLDHPVGSGVDACQPGPRASHPDAILAGQDIDAAPGRASDGDLRDDLAGLRVEAHHLRVAGTGLLLVTAIERDPEGVRASGDLGRCRETADELPRRAGRGVHADDGSAARDREPECVEGIGQAADRPARRVTRTARIARAPARRMRPAADP